MGLKAFCWGFLLSLVAYGCADEGAKNGVTAAECVRENLVAQCPPNTMPELSANSEALCTGSGQANGSVNDVNARVDNVCAGSGSCQLVCKLINPCEFGVERVSPADGVICRIPEGGCGDGVCEAGEDPSICPQDCESECVGNTSRCVEGQLQRCAPNGLLEEPVDCPPSYTCVEADDQSASCEGGCEPDSARCTDGALQRCSASGVYESPQSCRDDEVCQEDGDAAYCRPASCGDSVVQEGTEECDDGNSITESCAYGVESCMVCNAMCMWVPGEIAFCGDNILQESDEECDDGDTNQALCPYNETSCEVCNEQCDLVPGEPSAFCGDGNIDSEYGEVCEGDAQTVAENGSCPHCQPAICGDGVRRADISNINDPEFEFCDEGPEQADVFADGCNAQCQLTEVDTGFQDCSAGGVGGVCGPENSVCEENQRCINRSRPGQNGRQGHCQNENLLEFEHEHNGNKVARVEGRLITQGGKRDVDIFRYRQLCGNQDDPNAFGIDCGNDENSRSQYLFVLDFEAPSASTGGFNESDYPSFSPAMTTNSCNGEVNDVDDAWVACKCPEWHPLCARAPENRFRAFWCVSAEVSGEYSVVIGEGIDDGWPARTINYTLEVTEMLGVTGCTDYQAPVIFQLCDRGNNSGQ